MDATNMFLMLDDIYADEEDDEKMLRRRQEYMFILDTKMSASSTNWSKCTVAQLKDELASRGLDTSGKKADLVERLVTYEKGSQPSMAEESVLGHVEEILTCAMCLEILENPRTLQCLHSYCLKCLNQLTTSNESIEGYTCHQCRRFTASTDARTVHLVVQLLDAYNAANKVKDGINCDLCKEKPAKWRCMTCFEDNYQCDSCKSTHDKYMRISKQKHHVISLDELTDLDADRVLDRPMYCDKHNEHKPEVFCTVCEQVVCVLCKVLHHGDHKSILIAEALENVHVEMDKGLNDLENIVSDHQQQIKELQSQWQQTSKDYDEEDKELDEELEAAIAKLRSEHKAKKEKIETKRLEKKKETDDAIADREYNIKEETLLIGWITTTRTKTTGACLLAEFQGNLISKVKSVVQRNQPKVYHSTRCFPWDINLSNNWKQEHQFQLQNTTQSHPYTRLSIIWGHLAAVNHNTKELFTYNLNGTAAQSLNFTGNINQPRVVVQVSDTNGVLAAASGLYLINRSAQILQVMDQGNFSDVCVKKDKAPGRTQIFGLEWKTGQVKVYEMGMQVKLAKTIQLENYGVDNSIKNSNYCNTFVFSEDFIVVSMINANRIVRYDHNGKRLEEYPKSQTGLSGYPSICGIDSKSALLVTDYYNQRVGVVRNNKFESILTNTPYPWYAVFETSNILWVLLFDGSIHKYKIRD